MKLSDNVIIEYKKFLKDIPMYIELSGKKKMFIAQRAGIPYKTFSRKLKAGNFSPDESQKIVDAINNNL